MKQDATVGTYVLYNHHTLSLIANPRVLVAIGHRVWIAKTKKYEEGHLVFSPIIQGRAKSTTDWIQQINTERALWQKAKVGHGIRLLTIRAIFEAKEGWS
jgi:hypothetical protein